MTLIELYDKARIENIAGALLMRPEKLILIGDNQKTIVKSIPIYENILKKRNIHTTISYKTVNKNNLSVIVEQLSLIVEENSDCIFDLTGGEDLYLVAMGILMERYKDRISCHRFNFKNSTAIDCDSDGKVVSMDSFNITVAENILLYGGKIVEDENSVNFVFDEDFIRDVNVIWNISKENQKKWNASAGTIGDILTLCNEKTGLDVSFNENYAKQILQNSGRSYGLTNYFLRTLHANGLINSLSIGDDISFSFKSVSVKHALSVPGKMLELLIACKLSEITDDNGDKIYNDVRVGTLIDWSIEDDEPPTLNEIDVLAMKDAIPIFISCKSGIFDVNELYKLKTVSSRFGDDYAKCVLVATSLERLGCSVSYIRSRAEEMKIRILDNVDEASDAELRRVLKSLHSN